MGCWYAMKCTSCPRAASSIPNPSHNSAAAVCGVTRDSNFQSVPSRVKVRLFNTTLGFLKTLVPSLRSKPLSVHDSWLLHGSSCRSWARRASRPRPFMRRQFGIRDKLNILTVQQPFRFSRRERFQLNFTRLQQSCTCCSQVIIRIARMANQFPCAFRQRGNDR